MENFLAFWVVAGPLIALSWFLGQRSAPRSRHPLWPAFTATAAAAVCLAAGMFGYNLDALDATAAGTPWAGKVLWGEVVLGIALVAVAAYYWRRGLRYLRPGPPA